MLKQAVKATKTTAKIKRLRSLYQKGLPAWQAFLHWTLAEARQRAPARFAFRFIKPDKCGTLRCLKNKNSGNIRLAPATRYAPSQPPNKRAMIAQEGSV